MFKLSRQFLFASLIGNLLLIIGLTAYYRHLAFRDLIDHEMRANQNLTQAIANTIWPRYSSLINDSRGATREKLLLHPEMTALQQDVFEKMKGLNIAKVKIYNLDGLTVFSTELEQIGEDKSHNAGFQDALHGRAVGDLTFRDRFDAFEGVIHNRNLVYSYIPIYSDDPGRAAAVFEVYSDVTELVAHLERTQWSIIFGVLTGLALLYLFLFVLVQRVDRLISRQAEERLVNEERIRFQAHHDVLTSLPNRLNFSERLDQSLKLAKRTARIVAVMFIDLDRFKWVNDSLGHDAGDNLLQLVAKRFKTCIRESDLLFRVGGDEFTVILQNLEQSEEAAWVARRIINAMLEPIRIGEHEIVLGASIGITTFPNDANTAEQLVKNADTAMYLAKESGRNRFEFYTDAISQKVTERLALEQGLRQALQKNEFTLHYQPRVAFDGRPIGCEALLRWNHPRLGLLEANRFIDLLEDSGLIIAVGEWVLRTACAQNKAWQTMGLPLLRVSVNVSSRQFRHDKFISTVRAALRDAGLAAEYLEIELSENVLIKQRDFAITRINELKQLGVFLSIDDFGAGYSSLSYLREFPVDILKLDRSFLARSDDQRNRAIIHAIAGLATSLRMGFVVEGVERAEQAALLGGMECNELQGFLFSKPLPPEQLSALLRGEKDGAYTDTLSKGYTVA